MGKNHKSVMVLRIQPKFWWMIPMGVKDNHAKFEQENQQWRPGTGGASGRPRFHNLSQMAPKNALCLGSLVPRLSMEGAICIAISLDDEQIPLITVRCVLHPISGVKDLFLDPKYRKILKTLKSTLFAYLFTFHLPAQCFIAMDCVWHPCSDKY